MNKIINRRQLQKISDGEILDFFSKTVFHGIYSTEIKSNKNDYYKGSISNISFNGNPTDLCPNFLNVPTSSNNISEGPCKFSCRINLEAFRAEESRYIVNLIGNSLRMNHSEIAINNTADITEQDLFAAWGVDNCQFIGHYYYDEESETNVVDDIRKPNFDPFPFYPNDKKEKPIRIRFTSDLKGLAKNEYYLFTWKLSKKK